jgi:hypothetical protein
LKITLVLEVDIKNDGLTQDAGDVTIGSILADRAISSVTTLPWVLNAAVYPVPAREDA